MAMRGKEKGSRKKKKAIRNARGKKSFVNMKQNVVFLILNDLQRPPPLTWAKYFTVILHAPLLTL